MSRIWSQIKNRKKIEESKSPWRIFCYDFSNWSLFLWTLWKKKQQVDENGKNYTLFRIDIYFSECFLVVEFDEKGHTDRDIIFEEKILKALEKKLVVNLLELIQVMQKMVMI